MHLMKTNTLDPVQQYFTRTDNLLPGILVEILVQLTP